MIQSNHKEQMEELKKSNFDSRFYSLVYYKNDLLNAIKVKDHQSVETSGLQVFDDISSFFITELSKFDKEIDLNILKTHYHEYLVKINNKKAVLSIYSYFKIYKSIYLLVDNAGLTDKEKNLYMNVLKGLISTSEQMLLFFIAPLYPDLLEDFRGREIFNNFKINNVSQYIDQFYDASYFNLES